MKERIKELFWKYLIVGLVCMMTLGLIDILNKNDFWITGNHVIVFLVICLLDNTWFNKK